MKTSSAKQISVEDKRLPFIFVHGVGFFDPKTFKKASSVFSDSDDLARLSSHAFNWTTIVGDPLDALTPTMKALWNFPFVSTLHPLLVWILFAACTVVAVGIPILILSSAWSGPNYQGSHASNWKDFVQLAFLCLCIVITAGALLAVFRGYRPRTFELEASGIRFFASLVMIPAFWMTSLPYFTRSVWWIIVPALFWLFINIVKTLIFTLLALIYSVLIWSTDNDFVVEMKGAYRDTGPIIETLLISALFLLVSWYLTRHLLKPIIDVARWLADVEYRNNIRRELSLFICDTLSSCPGKDVILAGHSLGTVIAIDYLLSNESAQLQTHRVTLITMGSPLKRLIWRCLPGSILGAEDILDLLSSRFGFRWIHVYRKFDPVGGGLMQHEALRRHGLAAWLRSAYYSGLPRVINRPSNERRWFQEHKVSGKFFNNPHTNYLNDLLVLRHLSESMRVLAFSQPACDKWDLSGLHLKRDQNAHYEILLMGQWLLRALQAFAEWSLAAGVIVLMFYPQFSITGFCICVFILLPLSVTFGRMFMLMLYLTFVGAPLMLFFGIDPP